MYVVTGGAGFIGSAFVAKLNNHGIQDILVVDEPGSPEKSENLRSLKYREYVDKDEFLPQLAASKWTNLTAIIHMGACSSTTERDVAYLTKNNYAYSRTLAEYCLKQKIRYIYASSAATYGDGALGYDDDEALLPKLRPLNPYGDSKQQFDMWLLENGLTGSVAGLKFFNVYGPNEYHKRDMRSVVHKAYQQILETGEVKLFRSHRPDYQDGEQKRDFIYIKDCTETMWRLLENPGINGIFNLGTGEARTWNSLVHGVFSALNREPKIEYIDMPPDIRPQYQYFTEAKMDRLKATGAFPEPTSLEDGTREYVQEFLESGNRHLR